MTHVRVMTYHMTHIGKKNKIIMTHLISIACQASLSLIASVETTVVVLFLFAIIESLLLEIKFDRIGKSCAKFLDSTFHQMTDQLINLFQYTPRTDPIQS